MMNLIACRSLRRVRLQSLIQQSINQSINRFVHYSTNDTVKPVNQSINQPEINQPSNQSEISQSITTKEKSPKPNEEDTQSQSDTVTAKLVFTNFRSDQYEQSINQLKKLQTDGVDSNNVLSLIANELSLLTSFNSENSALVAQLWDACAAKQVNIDWFSLSSFAASFDNANDVVRIQQLADYMEQKPLQVPACISPCSLMLHILVSREITNDHFQSHISRLMAIEPSINARMMQNGGAIELFLMHNQLDNAVNYLRQHASSLSFHSRSWNQVMDILAQDGTQSEVLYDLYDLWMSVLPSDNRIKQISHYKSIVPDVTTYEILLNIPKCSISPHFMLSKLDYFELPSSSILHTAMFCLALEKKDKQAAISLWDDMCRRSLSAGELRHDQLYDLLSFYDETFSRDGPLPGEVIRFSSLAMLWDMCSAAKLDIQWKPLHMFAAYFDIADDVNRICQLAEYMTHQPTDRRDSVVSACALMIHMLASRNIVLPMFKSMIDNNVAKPTYPVAMMRNSGTIESLLRRKEVAQAVAHLRVHAANLQCTAIAWNRVIKQLHQMGSDSEALAMYEFWISKLPPINILKKLRYYRKIMPDAVTYELMFLIPQFPLTGEQVMSKMAKFRLPLSSLLYERWMYSAWIKDDYAEIVAAWKHMCRRSLPDSQLGVVLEKPVIPSSTSIVYVLHCYTQRFYVDGVMPRDAEDALFLVHLWDACCAQKEMVIKWLHMYMFTVCFDHVDDVEHLRQVVERMTRTDFYQDSRAACSVMLHVLSSRGITDSSLNSCISRLLVGQPHFDMTMMRHYGAIEWFVVHSKLDEAVAYLREHGSSLHIHQNNWNRVIADLRLADRGPEAISLYDFWVALLPAAEELQQLPRRDEIVPNVLTANLVSQISGSKLSSTLVLDQINYLDLSKDSILYDKLMKMALRKKEDSL